MTRNIGIVDIGDRVAIRCEFTADGLPVDPTDLVVRLRSPSGLINNVYTDSSPEVSRVATGVWVLTEDIVANDPGPWHVRFEGTGAVVAASEAVMNVRHSVFYS